MPDSTVRPKTFSLRQLMAVVSGLALLFGGLAWGERNGAFWWVSQSLDCSLYFYPRFAWAAGAASLVALMAVASDRRVWRLRSLWMLLPIAVPMALLAFGIAFRQYTGAPMPTTDLRRHVVEAFPWLHLPIGIILLGCFRSVSNWIIIGGISTAAVWFSFGAQIMSWMSVTNVWL